METVRREKIKNIELLRFIFALQIVVFHFFSSKDGLALLYPDIEIYQKIARVIRNSYLGVDFFFIIAGFFLVYTFKNISVLEFVKKKAVRLLIPILFSGFIWVDLSLFTPLRFDVYRYILEIFLIKNIGFTPENFSSYFWFVSPLFWGLFFYFYLMKNYERKTVNLIIAVVSFVSFCILSNFTDMSLKANLVNAFGWLNLGFLRALSGIGIGYFIGIAFLDNYNKIKEIELTCKSKIAISLLEGFLLFYLIYYTSFHTMNHTKIIFIIVFILLFLLLLFKQGAVSKILDNRFSVILGHYAYGMYIYQTTIRYIYIYVYPKNGDLMSLY